MPSVGTRIRVDVPLRSAPNGSGQYLVADVDKSDNVSAWPLGCSAPSIRAGTPCLVEYRVGGQRICVGATTLNAGPHGLVIQLYAQDQRRFPRFRRPTAMTIEVPTTSAGLIEGVTEDLSLGGLRAKLPVAVPTDRRSFVSLELAGGDPIMTVARTLSCTPVGGRGAHLVRVQFTAVSANDQARLFVLLDWPIQDSPASRNPTARLMGGPCARDHRPELPCSG